MDWAFGSGSGVSLEVPVRPYDEDGIVQLLHELNSMGWTSAGPRWNIQQSGANWHGVGAWEFVEALRAWKKREQSLDDAHHSEQVSYFDTCQGGGCPTLPGTAHRRASFRWPGCSPGRCALPSVRRPGGPARRL